MRSQALLAFAGSLSLVSSLSFSSSDWTNLNYVKTIDLGGSVTHSLYNLNLEPGSSLSSQPIESSISNTTSLTPSSSGNGYPYIISLSRQESIALSSSEVTVKLGSGSTPKQRAILTLNPLLDSDQPSPTTIQESEDNGSASSSRLYAFYLPEHLFPISKDEDQALSVTIAMTLNHVTSPLPKEVEQKGEQKLVWTDDVGLRSIYETQKGRVKVRSPHPRIVSHAILPSPSSSKSSTPSLAEATKSGAFLTYGPFEKTSPISLQGKGTNYVAQARVHFVHDMPVVSMVTLDRHVEVSHWGDNLATEDRIWLRNDGPKLKGHFSRIDHQMSAFYAKANSHVLSSLLMHLPPGARDPYFIDQIGNVSTSNFRPSPPSPKSISTSTHLLSGNKVSTLELKPRYPMLGGWNYTFSVGWNLPLGDGGWGKKIGSEKYSVATPFLTPVTDLAVDHVRTKIVLPEGATDIKIQTPFGMDSITHEIFTTYLDSTGRPAIVLEKSQCSEWHGRLIYVTYTLSPIAHLRKPLTVTAVVLCFFIGASLLRRWDFSIKPSK